MPRPFGHHHSRPGVPDLSALPDQGSARYYGQIDRAVRRADHIIAVSESTKHDLVRCSACPRTRSSVIYEAADPLFQPYRSGRGAPARPGAVGSAGRIHPVRQHHRAAQERRRPAARLSAAARRLQADAGAGPGRRARLAQRRCSCAGGGARPEAVLLLPRPCQLPDLRYPVQRRAAAWCIRPSTRASA